MEKKNRKKMPVEQRAKQFMPFAAVTGLEEALYAKEIEFFTIEKPEIFEEEIENSFKLISLLETGDEIILKYYENGYIKKINGMFEKADKDKCYIYLEGRKIDFNDIIEVRRK